MTASQRERLPVEPLLHAYLDAGLADVDASRLPGLGSRFKAIQAATATFLDEHYLDHADDEAFQTAVIRFYEACVSPPLHVSRLKRRSSLLRHGLIHLLRGQDGLPQKLARCVSDEGPYFLAGLGPTFWGSIVQGLQPTNHPAWTPAVEVGLHRLHLLDPCPGDSPETTYANLGSAFQRLHRLAPQLTSLHLEHFLSLVANMIGRNLLAGLERLSPLRPGVDLLRAIQLVRQRQPLRHRLKERGQEMGQAQDILEEGLSCCQGKQLARALAVVDAISVSQAPLDWHGESERLTLWVGRLWENDDPYPILEAFWADPIPGAGLWLPSAVLHLKDAQHYGLWNDRVRVGHALLDDSAERGDLVDRYRRLNETLGWVRERHGLHPLETVEVLAALTGTTEGETTQPQDLSTHRFKGFCADTFRFLHELAANNRREWMEQHRDRYQFVVRSPLTELCQALTERYVDPVLKKQYGWEVETDARNGLALTSVVKNDFGRSQPYNTTFWVTFCGREARGRRQPTQFFVRLDASGLAYGLRLGESSHARREQLRQRLLAQSETLFAQLLQREALAHCRVYQTEGAAEGVVPATLAEFQQCLAHKEMWIVRSREPRDPLLGQDDLVGEVLLTFDRLLPLYAAYTGTTPLPELTTAARGSFTDEDFQRATHLPTDWLGRVQHLLQLKRQLILQGVPGTGKTFVARCLARRLTGDVPEAFRLVQFHPAYSYEEFVEGIKIKTVEVHGRHEVTYPVEQGLLCTFVEQAAQHPAQPHVLLIDEINRGNLPRIFGELLYLLEYRDQEIVLPYSRRPFRLPPNLIVLGTMNAQDRSTVLIDQALRRRFSFVEMTPDASLLTNWLNRHPPEEGNGFAQRVVGLFERLNTRLRLDLGADCQVGHSYFMVPQLNLARLRVIWQHQIRPLLDEYVFQHPGRTISYELEELLHGERRSRKPASHSV